MWAKKHLTKKRWSRSKPPPLPLPPANQPSFRKGLSVPHLSKGESSFTIRIVDNKKVKLDPFIAIDDFFARFPSAFLDHPHRGFESATFVLPEQENPNSRLLYYDSTLGQAERALTAGGLVRMICGRGISHCEVVEHEEHLMRAVNFWIDYPRSDKMCPPRSEVHELGGECMPVSVEDGVRTIALQGSFRGISGRCFEDCPTELECAHFTLARSRSIVVGIPSSWNAIIYCLNGTGYVNGEKLRVADMNNAAEAHNSLRLSIDDADYKASEERVFQISTTDDSCIEVMYLAGEPTKSPKVVFDIDEDGSSDTFVMSSKKEIKDSLRAWINAEDGFEYRDEWISPGMQTIMKVWNDVEKPAQDRTHASPLTTQISGLEVEMMRRLGTDMVQAQRRGGDKQNLDKRRQLLNEKLGMLDDDKNARRAKMEVFRKIATDVRTLAKISSIPECVLPEDGAPVDLSSVPNGTHPHDQSKKNILTDLPSVAIDALPHHEAMTDGLGFRKRYKDQRDQFRKSFSMRIQSSLSTSNMRHMGKRLGTHTQVAGATSAWDR